MSQLENHQSGTTPFNNASSPAPVEQKPMPAVKPAVSSGSSESSEPPQFKIVKVRKPDGTIVKVKRPITAEEAAKLKNAPSKPTAPAAVNIQSPAKSSESSVPAQKTEISSPVLQDTPQKQNLESKPTSTPATETAKVVAPENITSNTTENTSKPSTQAAPAPLSKTDSALNTAAHGARLYTGLRRLHRGSSKLISVLAPQWDIDDWQDGDEDFSDDEDGDDDDGEAEEKYDSDDDEEQNSGDMHAAAKDMTNSAATNIASLNTPRPQPRTEISEKKAEANAKNIPSMPEKSPVICEKEIPAGDAEKLSPEKTSAVGEKSLHKRYKDWSRYIIWAIMILFPLLFMIIGILVAARDKKPYDSSLGSGTTQALEVAISIWPIVFAAIVAQSLRAYATYRVERGVRLMTLEQLVNSNSVASSIKQPFLLRRFNWITLALLTLWGLSPLATQAMQRISSTSSEATKTPDKLRYVNTAVNNSNYLSASTSEFSKVEAEFNRLYSAAFLPTYVTLGSDPYNNALIPKLDDPSMMTWQNTDPTNGAYPIYASTYGVPVASVDNSSAYDYFTDSSTFNISIAAAYLEFSCAPLEVIDADFFLNSTLTLGDSTETTLYLSMTPMSGKTNGSLALASLITLNTTDPNSSTDIDLNDPGYNFTYAYTNCSFAQVFVDVNISCQTGQCYAYAVKPTNLTNTTATPGFVDSGSDNWVTGLLGTSGTTNYSTPTATDTERYLMNYGTIDASNPRMNLTTLDSDSLSYNLGFLMNTFWSIGFAPTNLTNLFYNSTSEPFNKDLATSLPISYASGFKIDSHDIYKTNWGWLAALFICSAFLLLAGIFSIWWDARTVSPDVLGFASSVVRKSKYVQLPPVASAASGAERARALGDVRVMMQDVKPSASVGRIALGTAHPNAQRLQSGRAYR